VSSTATVAFDSLRDDWVKGADLVVRLIARSEEHGTLLVGFPRQWIPIFVHFGARWKITREGTAYVPLASDLSEEDLVRLSAGAQARGALRSLVEAFASLDPLIADVLYKLDRRMSTRVVETSQHLPLTGWQSYGRPEVLALNTLVEKSAQAKKKSAVLLPCARKRPYAESKTHRRIWRELKASSVDPAMVDQLVVSSIGIVPEILWNDPVVLAYDSGVPDIYRVLRLMRIYFRKAHYEVVIDCLEFKPYSDCLRIVAREGMIGEVRLGRSGAQVAGAMTAKNVRPFLKPETDGDAVADCLAWPERADDYRHQAISLPRIGVLDGEPGGCGPSAALDRTSVLRRSSRTPRSARTHYARLWRVHDDDAEQEPSCLRSGGDLQPDARRAVHLTRCASGQQGSKEHTRSQIRGNMHQPEAVGRQR
jgi:hypothetical protein